MLSLACPECQQGLPLVSGAKYHCESCVLSYNLMVKCPQCRSELEQLKACGAVNYFCPSCNELKSKSKVIRQLEPAHTSGNRYPG